MVFSFLVFLFFFSFHFCHLISSFSGSGSKMGELLSAGLLNCMNYKIQSYGFSSLIGNTGWKSISILAWFKCSFKEVQISTKLTAQGEGFLVKISEIYRVKPLLIRVCSIQYWYSVLHMPMPPIASDLGSKVRMNSIEGSLCNKNCWCKLLQ